jgi:hypothetical protein
MDLKRMMPTSALIIILASLTCEKIFIHIAA